MIDNFVVADEGLFFILTGAAFFVFIAGNTKVTIQASE